ncbi:iron transporter [Halospeciosus flavus]
MPVVWDNEAKIVPPDVNPQITVEQDGERVANVSPWPMLSQPMGVHFGDNVALPGDGTYQVSIRIGEPSVKRTGSLKDGEYGPATFEFEFDFSESKLNEIEYTDIPSEKEGTPGAVVPSEMTTVQMTQAPTKDALPGTVRATGTSDDAKLVVTTIDGAEPYGGSTDQTYLAVSARTPYNRFVLPAMALSGTLTRDGETVFDGQFDAALDGELNYHYGTALSNVQSGDELEITVDAPSQTARHEGYETAFYQMDPVTLTL